MNIFSEPSRGIMKLIASIAVVLVIWLGILPRVARIKPVQAHLQQLEDSHVDAGVIFYSELDPRVFPEPDALNQLLRERGAK